MARGGVNKAVVKIARNALLARGLHPSIDAVRVELGNTGSKTTIQRYLKELAEVEAPEPEMPVDEELARYIGSLVERMKQTAQRALASDRAAFEHEQAVALHQREVEQARWDQLRRAHDALTQARQEGLAYQETLSVQLQACELEQRRLQEAHQQQVRLLEERAAQISSLEEKHQFTQEALDHYREQHVLQRERETQRHDQQILQLQRDARAAHDQLLSKQEELSQIYRDLERMSGEQLRFHQEARRLEHALQSMQEQLQAAQLEHRSNQRQMQGLAHQATALRQTVKQHLTKRRETQRELRAKDQLITHLQTLVDRLTPSATKDPS
jgi:chromosome segregation ATPase